MEWRCKPKLSLLINPDFSKVALLTSHERAWQGVIWEFERTEQTYWHAITITHSRETSKTGRTCRPWGLFWLEAQVLTLPPWQQLPVACPSQPVWLSASSSLASQAYTVRFFEMLQYFANSPTSFLCLSLAYAADRFCLFAI